MNWSQPMRTSYKTTEQTCFAPGVRYQPLEMTSRLHCSPEVERWPDLRRRDAVYRASYVLLMNFVPDKHASRMHEVTEAARAWKESDQGAELLAVALEMFSRNADLFAGQSVTTQGHAMAKEFDDRFSQVMTAARTSRGRTP
jgi:hypothetical protein